MLNPTTFFYVLFWAGQGADRIIQFFEITYPYIKGQLQSNFNLQLFILMKRSTTGFLTSILLILLPLITTAQKVSRLEIRSAIREISSKPYIAVEVYVPMDLSGFAIDNPVDFEKSSITVFQDNTGTDFLALHKKQQGQLRAQGYTANEKIFQFGGVADYGKNKDIKVIFKANAAPAPNATEIKISGTAILNFLRGNENKVTEINNIPVEMEYDSPGIETKLGFIKIEDAGSATIEEDKYQKFRVVGGSTPIVGVEVIGGDDSDKVNMWGMNANEFIVKDIPETVSLKISYNSFKKVEVPIDLSFSIGL